MNEQSEFDTVRDLPALPSVAAPASDVIGVDLAGQTHTGRLRSTNEDHFHIVEFGRYLLTLASSLPAGEAGEEPGDPGYAFAVADGIGGRAGGEVASRLAIGLLIEYALQTPDWILGQDEELLAKVMNRFAQRFKAVNLAVLTKSDSDPALRGMGTTLSVALNLGSDLLVAHVGDSRVSLLRDEQFHRLTRDQTGCRLVSDPSKSDGIRLRRVLTNAIGLTETGGEPELYHYKLKDGDRLLLCTDGLTDMVDEESISRALGGAPTATEACQSLIDLALDRGGRDNVTAVVAIYRRVVGTHERNRQSAQPERG
jgi:PPM family protein phosphatase